MRKLIALAILIAGVTLSIEPPFQSFQSRIILGDDGKELPLIAGIEFPYNKHVIGDVSDVIGNKHIIGDDSYIIGL